MTSPDYDNRIHHRCVEWVRLITSPTRSLKHKAALCRFCRMVPVIHEQVNMMIGIKVELENVAKQIVRNPNITIHIQ